MWVNSFRELTFWWLTTILTHILQTVSLHGYTMEKYYLLHGYEPAFKVNVSIWLLPHKNQIWGTIVSAVTLCNQPSIIYLGPAPSEGACAGIDHADVVAIQDPDLLVDLREPGHHLGLARQTEVLQLPWQDLHTQETVRTQEILGLQINLNLFSFWGMSHKLTPFMMTIWQVNVKFICTFEILEWMMFLC